MIESRPIPTRVRPFEKTQQATPALLKVILGRPLAPSRREYDEAVAGLNVGDTLMDPVADWLMQSPKAHRGMFQQALTQGVESLSDCPPELQALFAEVDRVPAWVDRQLMDEGIRFIHASGLTALQVMRDLALMGGYLLSGFNQALVMTGALTNGTSQRVAETGKWWMDCTERGGLERFGAGTQSTLHVRLVHAIVRRQLNQREDWDHAQWGLPLNQIDMAATYLGFSVVMLGGLRKLGIQATPQEARGVMQLWSYACWLMGVDEKWLRFSESEGVILLNTALMTQSRADWTSKALGKALSEEPLVRRFPAFAKYGLEQPMRKFVYHQHLSVSRYFLTPEQFDQLGLPTHIIAWYPWLTLAPRAFTYTAQRLLPRWHQRQVSRGRAAQRAAVGAVFGKKPHQLTPVAPGASA
jgi:hypothetical protein